MENDIEMELNYTLETDNNLPVNRPKYKNTATNHKKDKQPSEPNKKEFNGKGLL